MLLNDQTIKCWGTNTYGQLGIGSKTTIGDDPGEMGDNLPAVDLGAGSVPEAVSVANNHSCALLAGGTVKCWGRSNLGQLGLGDQVDRGDDPGEMGDNLPAVDLGLGKTADAIEAAGNNTCALLNDGSVKCWGYNSWGQLGLGDEEHRGDGPDEMGDNLPALDFGAGQVVTKIVKGLLHTCVLLQAGQIKCWGRNVDGQLGMGDTADRGDQPGEMGDNLPFVEP